MDAELLSITLEQSTCPYHHEYSLLIEEVGSKGCSGLDKILLQTVEMFTITQATVNFFYLEFKLLNYYKLSGVKSKLFFLMSLSSLGNFEDFSVYV